jgi:hypothetical protein
VPATVRSSVDFQIEVPTKKNPFENISDLLRAYFLNNLLQEILFLLSILKRQRT